MPTLSSMDAGLSSTRISNLQQFIAPFFSLYAADSGETGSRPSASAHSEVIYSQHAWHMLPDESEVSLHVCCLV